MVQELASWIRLLVIASLRQLLPRLLRPDKVTQTQTGSSGFCREPSFGMEVGAGNVHRVCADFDAGGACSESQITDGSDMSRTCSDTAAHRVGAGHGHTVGFLYPFLRPFVERNATTGVFRAKASTAWAVAPQTAEAPAMMAMMMTRDHH